MLEPDQPRSALTLRLVLATFGLVVFTGAGIALYVFGVVVLAAIAFVIAATAVVDIVVVARRKLRGEPG